MIKKNTNKIDFNQLLNKHYSAVNILLFFFIIGLSYFIINLAYKATVNYEKKVNDKFADIARRESNLDQLSNLKGEFPDFSSKVDILEKIVSFKSMDQQSVDPGQFLVQIYKISTNSELKLTSISPSLTNMKIEAKVDLSGTYDDFIAYLDEIEKNILITEVSSINISGVGESKQFSITVKPAI